MILARWAHEIAVQRVDRPVPGHGLARRHHGLADHLATKHAADTAGPACADEMLRLGTRTHVEQADEPGDQRRNFRIALRHGRSSPCSSAGRAPG